MNHTNYSPALQNEHAPQIVMLAEDYAQLRPLAKDNGLSEELDRAIVVPRERMPADVVRMRSRCLYIDENTGEEREIELVYPDEADPVEGKISVLAPIGSALLGLAAGEAIDWELPGGRIHRLRVISVVHPSDAVSNTTRREP